VVLFSTRSKRTKPLGFADLEFKGKSFILLLKKRVTRQGYISIDGIVLFLSPDAQFLLFLLLPLQQQ